MRDDPSDPWPAFALSRWTQKPVPATRPQPLRRVRYDVGRHCSSSVRTERDSVRALLRGSEVVGRVIGRRWRMQYVRWAKAFIERVSIEIETKEVIIRIKR